MNADPNAGLLCGPGPGKVLCSRCTRIAEMNSTDVSRRGFALMAGGLAGGITLSGAGAPSANDVVKQIRESLGGDWSETGLDGFKAGNPETAVHGIATTAMATMDVLSQAAKAGLNLIVTHEPTF